MKRVIALLCCFSLGTLSFAAPLASNARTAIPSQVQQIISVDYRALRNSDSGMALKNKILPDTLKQFEVALKAMSIDPDSDVESLSFVMFRSGKQLRSVGFATGEFQLKKFVAQQNASKVKPEKYRTTSIYQAGSGMVMTFLDEGTMLFGETQAVHEALDARDGEAPTLASNAEVTNLLSSVQDGAVWSVLDSIGTQNMLRSGMGPAAKIAEYDIVKKHLNGSYYTMDFSHGVTLDLTIATGDPMAAATLSSLLKAGIMLKKMGASPAEQTAIDATTVDNSSGNLLMHFKADDNKFQSLLQSDLFTAISH
ncbi:MAG: hypothetical protein ABSD88_12420 [Candidatus Korobacteraceae bacterium]|jgi:hypothetical protein